MSYGWFHHVSTGSPSSGTRLVNKIVAFNCALDHLVEGDASAVPSSRPLLGLCRAKGVGGPVVRLCVTGRLPR